MSKRGNRFEQKHNRYLGSVPDEPRIIEEKLEFNPTQKQINFYNSLRKKCTKFDCEKPKQPKTRSEFSDAIDFYVNLLQDKPTDEEISELLSLFDKMTRAQRTRYIGYGEGLLGKVADKPNKRKNS